MTVTRQAYLDASASAVALLSDPATTATWDKPSALAEFRVSGLAGHLAGQILAVPQVLAEEIPDEPPATLLDHYERATWVGADVDAEVNVHIRNTGDRLAESGPQALLAATESALSSLREVVPAQPAGRVVHLSGRWSLSLDDYLTTRMLEIAIHSDDLALSVGVPTPALPDAVLDPVFALLTRLSIRRYGPTALLRALSRAERAPATIAAI